MTVRQITATASTAVAIADRSLGRRALGLLAPVGPLAMAGWAISVPYQVGDGPAEWIPEATAGLARLQLSMWMLLIFALTAGAGAIVTGLVARRGSLRLGTVGLVLTFAGFTALSFGGAGYDAAAVATQKAGLDVGTGERVLAEIEKFQAPALGGALLIPLMFVGVIILGIALWRGRTVPRWAAVTMVASFPVIMAGGFIAMPINALGWALLAIAFGAAGQAYARRTP